MTNHQDGFTELSPLDQDKAFIDATGEPLRDAEMLSWDNLYFDSKFKVIRCNTCGCPAEICTCSKVPENKLEDFCIECGEHLTIEQRLKGVCSQHG